MLMTLGTLATTVAAQAANLTLLVVENGTFEITGHQLVPAAGRLDFAAMARAAGFPRVFRYEEAEVYAHDVPDLLRTPGPTFASVLVERSAEGPISRSATEEARYLRTSLAAWSRSLRDALAQG
jgi:thiamine pyrophosphate-dependent acetolactate synthase large subunit-like protein